MRGRVVAGICWAVVLGPACLKEPETCESRLAGLCEAPGTGSRETLLRVDGALRVDFEGDGKTEIFAFSRDGRQVGVAQLGPEDQSSQLSAAMFLVATPTAAAAVEAAGGQHEVVVALADPPGLAFYGVDADGRLERRRDLALESDPEALWAGDLDGDGRSELLVAAASGAVSIVDPKSGDPRELASGSHPVAIAVAELDGDGSLDVAVADHARESVLVVRGAGAGKFHAAKEFPLGAPVESLELADVDGDGALDVLARGRAEPAVILCRNDGAGELAAPVLLPFADAAPDGVGLVASPAVAGVVSVNVPQGERVGTWYTQTGDEWLGHAEAYLPNTARWVGGGTESGFLVGGDGMFGQFVYRRGLTPVELWRDEEVRSDRDGESVAVGDLDADGLVDIAAASSGKLFLYQGLPDGSFERITELEPGTTPEQMLIAEVTGDEAVDLVLLEPPNVRVVRGGEFVLGPAFVPAVEPLSGLVVRNGAGMPERIAVSPTDKHYYYSPTGEPGGVSILRFAADGAVAEETVVDETIRVRDVMSADLDGDTADEVMVFGMRDDAPVLTRWAPDGAGFVAGPQHDLVALTGINAEQMDTNYLAAGDTDEDGAPEVWIPTAGGIVRIDALDGDTPSAQIVPTSSLFAFEELRDVDGDGHLDQLAVWWTGDFVFRPGRGDGTFVEQSVGYSFPLEGSSAFAETGSQVDIVMMSRDTLAAHRLHDVPRSEPLSELDFGYFMGGTSDMVVGDIDQDGADDVVAISGATNGGIAVLWGGAGRVFERMDVFADAVETKGLTLADLDADGFPEVISSSGISWIEAHRFWPQREKIFISLDLGSLNRVHDLDVRDLDGDGFLDVLALINEGFEDAGELLLVAYGIAGEEYPPYTRWQLLLQAPEIEVASLAVADVNDDGRVDLLVRPSKPGSSVLLVSEGARAWSKGQRIAGESTVLAGPPDGAQLLVQAQGKIRRFDVIGAELKPGETLLEDHSLASARLTRAVDIDEDGQFDLFVEGETETTIWLAEGPGITARLQIPASEMKRVEVGDFDGDGQTDLIGRIDGKIAVRLSGGDAK